MRTDGRSDYLRIVERARGSQVDQVMPLRAVGYGLLFAAPLWVVLIVAARVFGHL